MIRNNINNIISNVPTVSSLDTVETIEEPGSWTMYIVVILFILIIVGGYFYLREDADVVPDVDTNPTVVTKKKEVLEIKDRNYVSSDKDEKLKSWGKKNEYVVDVTCNNDPSMIFDTQTMRCVDKPFCEKQSISSDYSSVTTFRIDKNNSAYNKCVDSRECSNKYTDDKLKLSEEKRRENFKECSNKYLTDSYKYKNHDAVNCYMYSKKKEVIGTSSFQEGTGQPVDVGTQGEVSDYTFNLVPKSKTECQEPNDSQKAEQCNSFSVGTNKPFKMASVTSDSQSNTCMKKKDCSQDKFASPKFLEKYNFASSSIVKNYLSGSDGAVCRNPTKTEIGRQCDKLGKNYMWNEQIKSCAPVSVSPNDWMIQILQTSSNTVAILVGWPEENLKKSGITNFQNSKFVISLIDMGNKVNDHDLDPPGQEPVVDENASMAEIQKQQVKYDKWKEANEIYNAQIVSTMEAICVPNECNDGDDDSVCDSNMTYICPYENYLIDQITWYFDDKSDPAKIPINSVEGSPTKQRKINEVGLPISTNSKQKWAQLLVKDAEVFSNYISNNKEKKLGLLVGVFANKPREGGNNIWETYNSGLTIFKISSICGENCPVMNLPAPAIVKVDNTEIEDKDTLITGSTDRYGIKYKTGKLGLVTNYDNQNYKLRICKESQYSNKYVCNPTGNDTQCTFFAVLAIEWYIPEGWDHFYEYEELTTRGPIDTLDTWKTKVVTKKLKEPKRISMQALIDANFKIKYQYIDATGRESSANTIYATDPNLKICIPKNTKEIQTEGIVKDRLLRESIYGTIPCDKMPVTQDGTATTPAPADSGNFHSKSSVSDRAKKIRIIFEMPESLVGKMEYQIIVWAECQAPFSVSDTNVQVGNPLTIRTPWCSTELCRRAEYSSNSLVKGNFITNKFMPFKVSNMGFCESPSIYDAHSRCAEYSYLYNKAYGKKDYSVEYSSSCSGSNSKDCIDATSAPKKSSTSSCSAKIPQVFWYDPAYKGGRVDAGKMDSQNKHGMKNIQENKCSPVNPTYIYDMDDGPDFSGPNSDCVVYKRYISKDQKNPTSDPEFKQKLDLKGTCVLGENLAQNGLDKSNNNNYTIFCKEDCVNGSDRASWMQSNVCQDLPGCTRAGDTDFFCDSSCEKKKQVKCQGPTTNSGLGITRGDWDLYWKLPQDTQENKRLTNIFKDIPEIKKDLDKCKDFVLESKDDPKYSENKYYNMKDSQLLKKDDIYKYPEKCMWHNLLNPIGTSKITSANKGNYDKREVGQPPCDVGYCSEYFKNRDLFYNKKNPKTNDIFKPEDVPKVNKAGYDNNWSSKVMNYDYKSPSCKCRANLSYTDTYGNVTKDKQKSWGATSAKALGPDDFKKKWKEQSEISPYNNISPFSTCEYNYSWWRDTDHCSYDWRSARYIKNCDTEKRTAMIDEGEFDEKLNDYEIDQLCQVYGSAGGDDTKTKSEGPNSAIKPEEGKSVTATDPRKCYGARVPEKNNTNANVFNFEGSTCKTAAKSTADDCDVNSHSGGTATCNNARAAITPNKPFVCQLKPSGGSAVYRR